MSDKLEMIYDLLKQDREEAADFRKEVRESHKDTGDRLAALEAQGQVQNQQLADHMRRTEILEDLHGINAGRIDVHDKKITELEKPQIAIKMMIKWVVGLGTLAGAGIAISKFLGLF